MPTSVRHIHRGHGHAPPQQLRFLSKTQKEVLFLFLKSMIMVGTAVLFLFFLGIAAIVILYFLAMSYAFRNHCAAARATAPVPDFQILFSEVRYSALGFPKAKVCAVCLDSFLQGDECRSLPACKHLFHVKCVDRWLQRMPTCPICRTPVNLDPQFPVR